MTIELQLDNDAREQRWRDVLVQVRTNLGYQQARRNILERRENLVKVVSLVSASVAFFDVKSLVAHFVGTSAATQAASAGSSALPHTVASASLWVAVPLLIIVLANVWGLVFQWGAKSRDAGKRFDAWSTFEAKVLRVGLPDYTLANLKEWDAEMADLESGEPKVNEYLARRAEREARRMYHNPRKSDQLELHGLERVRRDVSNILQYIPRLFYALP